MIIFLLLDLRVSSWHDSRASWYEWYWRHRQVEWKLEMGYCSQSWKKGIQVSKRTFAQMSNVPERQFNNFLSHLEVLNKGKSTGCLEKSVISACIIIDLDLLKSWHMYHVFLNEIKMLIILSCPSWKGIHGLMVIFYWFYIFTYWAKVKNVWNLHEPDLFMRFSGKELIQYCLALGQMN